MIEALKNINPVDIEKHLDKIPAIINEIKNKLPLMDNFEKTMRVEHKLSSDTMFLYSLMKSADNQKILVYVFAGRTLKEKIQSGTTILEKGTFVIDKKIKSIDLFEFANEISQNGINGIIDLLIL